MTLPRPFNLMPCWMPTYPKGKYQSFPYSCLLSISSSLKTLSKWLSRSARNRVEETRAPHRVLSGHADLLYFMPRSESTAWRCRACEPGFKPGTAVSRSLVCYSLWGARKNFMRANLLGVRHPPLKLPWHKTVPKTSLVVRSPQPDNRILHL